MLKKNTILILLLGTLLGLSSCGLTPGPRYYNGNYYWIDSNCVEVRPLTATSIECRNSDKEETGYCHHISNWFRGYLKKLGIKKKGKNFHSLRHTVINKLLTKQVYEPFIKELVGHSSGSITVDVYGGRKPADVLLNECVMKI